jgi:hypothetical protein
MTCLSGLLRIAWLEITQDDRYPTVFQNFSHSTRECWHLDVRLREETRFVRRYAFEKRQVPKAVEDLVTAGYLKAVPPPPAGMKYAIDEQKAVVVLVKE